MKVTRGLSNAAMAMLFWALSPAVYSSGADDTETSALIGQVTSAVRGSGEEAKFFYQALYHGRWEIAERFLQKGFQPFATPDEFGNPLKALFGDSAEEGPARVMAALEWLEGRGIRLDAWLWHKKYYDTELTQTTLLNLALDEDVPSLALVEGLLSLGLGKLVNVSAPGSQTPFEQAVLGWEDADGDDTAHIWRSVVDRLAAAGGNPLMTGRPYDLIAYVENIEVSKYLKALRLKRGCDDAGHTAVCNPLGLSVIEQPDSMSEATRPVLVRNTGHAGDVTSIDISDDHELLITTDSFSFDPSTAIVWHRPTGYQLRSFQLPATYRNDISNLIGVRLSNNGKYAYLLVGPLPGEDIESREWLQYSLNDGHLIGVEDFDDHYPKQGWVFRNLSLGILFDPIPGGFEIVDLDDRKILSGSIPGSGERSYSFRKHALSDNSEHFALVTPKGKVHVWNITSGEYKFGGLRIARRDRDIRKLQINNTGDLLAVDDGVFLNLWRIGSGEKLASLVLDKTDDSDWISDGELSEVVDLGFSPDGQHLLALVEPLNSSAVQAPSIYVLNQGGVAEGMPLKSATGYGFGLDSRLHTVEVESEQIHSIFKSDNGVEVKVISDPAGRFEVLRSDNAWSKISDGNGVEITSTDALQKLIWTDGQVMLDGSKLLSLSEQYVSADIKIYAHDLQNDTREKTFETAIRTQGYLDKNLVTKIATSHSDELVFAAGNSAWSYNQRSKMLREFNGYASNVSAPAVGVSSAGDLLATAHLGTLRIWDTATGRLVRTRSLSDRAYVANVNFTENDSKVTLTGSILADGSWQPVRQRFDSIGGSDAESQITNDFVDHSGRFVAKRFNGSIKVFEVDGESAKAVLETTVPDAESDPLQRGAHEVELQVSRNGDVLLIQYSGGAKVFARQGRGFVEIHSRTKRGGTFDFSDMPEKEQYGLPIGANDSSLLASIDRYHLSPDGKYLIGSGDFGSAAYVWSLPDFEYARRIEGDKVQIAGALILQHLDDSVFTIRLTDLSYTRVLFDASGSLADGFSQISEDGRWLINRTKEIVEFWDLEKGELTHLYSELAEKGPGSVSGADGWLWVRRDGRFDSSNLDQNSAFGWRIPNRPYESLRMESYIRQLFSPGAGALHYDASSKVEIDYSTINIVQPVVTIDQIEVVDGGRGARVWINVANTLGDDGDESSGVFSPRLLLNSRVVSTFNEAGSKINESGMVRIDVPPGEKRRLGPVHISLPAGLKDRVSISAYAFNRSGVKSVDAPARYIDTRTADSVVSRDAWVIAVGVNNNQTSKWKLAFASPSAAAIAQSMGNHLKASGEFRNIKQVSVFDPIEPSLSGFCGLQNLPPTKANILLLLQLLTGQKSAAISELVQNCPPLAELGTIGPNDLVFLSFSGHGVSAQKGGEYYLIPYDSRNVSVVGPALFKHSISSAELANALQDLNSTDAVLFLDTCTSADAITAGGFKPAPLGNAGLGQLAYDKRMPVLVAAQSGVSAEALGISRAADTLRKLLDEGVSADSAVDFVALFNSVSKRFSEDGTSRSQLPQVFDFLPPKPIGRQN